MCANSMKNAPKSNQRIDSIEYIFSKWLWSILILLCVVDGACEYVTRLYNKEFYFNAVWKEHACKDTRFVNPWEP